MFSLLLSAALAVQDTGPVAAAEPPDHVAATWAETPNIEFPAAFETGGEGSVTLTCAVTVEGRARDCTIAEESPEGFGIGDAALAASSTFRFNPATQGGVAIEDIATFSVRFQVSEEVRQGDGAQASPAMQRVFSAFDRLGFTSGVCATYLDDAEGQRLEAGLARYTAHQRELPVFDQVLLGGYGRGKESAIETPQSESYCASALASARSRLDDQSEEIAEVEAMFPPSARRQ